MSDMKSIRKNDVKINKRVPKIIIFGSGTVGQATGKGLINRGINDVLFVDINPNVVGNLIKRGLPATLPEDIEELEQEHIAMFCLPTEVNDQTGRIDLSHLSSALIHYAKFLKKSDKNDKFNLIVIRSSVPPDTTQNLLIPLLEMHSGMKAGLHFGVCMHPEFLRTLTSEQDFMNPRQIVIGEYDEMSGTILERLYKSAGFVAPIVRVSLSTSEFIKYACNCFNATKISFANEMWLLAEKLGIDSNFSLKIAADVAEGFWNPNYGIIGGRPFGGRCLPKDVRILQSFAEDVSTDMSILKAASLVNSKMEEIAELKEMAELSDIPIELESGTRQSKPTRKVSELNNEQIS
jgi:UDPglucose 6-dehydrogenase